MYTITMEDYSFLDKSAVVFVLGALIGTIALSVWLWRIVPSIPYSHVSIISNDYTDSQTVVDRLSSANNILLKRTNSSSDSSHWKIIVDDEVIATIHPSSQHGESRVNIIYTPSGNPIGHQEPRYFATNGRAPEETWIYDQYDNRVGGISEKSNDKPYPFHQAHGYELQDSDSNILSILPLKFDSAIFSSIRNTDGKDLWKIDKQLYNDGTIKLEKQSSDSISSINAIWSVIFMAERNRPYKDSTTEKR